MTRKSKYFGKRKAKEPYRKRIQVGRFSSLPIISPDQVQKGGYGIITKILERDHYKVTFLFNTREVKSFDFSQYLDFFRECTKFNPLLDEKNFATIYFDKVWGKVVIPAVQENANTRRNYLDVKYLRSQGFEPIDGVHFGYYYEPDPLDMYEDSEYICTYDEWCERKYPKKKKK